MQFLIIARDGIDEGALQRRLDARQAHIENTDQNMKHMVTGAATLNEDGQMNGSVMIVDFPSQEEFDAWFRAEPYVTEKVWEDITVLPCKVGPSFID